jgi:hypothetical protein
VIELPRPRKDKAPGACTQGALVWTHRAGIDPARHRNCAVCYAAVAGAFGLRPGAGAGTYPETRHCQASMVLPPS